MKELKKLAFAQRRRVVFLILLSLLLGAVIIGQAYLIVTIVDAVFLKGESFQEIAPLLASLLAIFISRAALAYLSGRTGVTMAAKVKGDFRKALLNKFSRNPIQASLKGQSGEKVSVMMDAVDELDSYFSKYFPQMIQTYIVPLMILIAVFVENPYSGLIMIITAPFIPFCMILIGGMTQKKQDKQLEKMTAFSARFLDTLQGLTTLKFFGRAKQQRELIRESSLGFGEATMDVLKVAFISSLLMELISMLSVGLVAVEVGLRLVIYESISFITAFFVLVLVPEFFNSLKNLGAAFHAGRGSVAAFKKVIAELDETEQPVQWGDQKLDTREQPPTLTLQGAGFSYGDDAFSLKGLDAEIPSFSQVAIVGRSGSGKTTLLHLLAGLVASEGQVLVNHRSRTEYKEKDWFDQLSYISQHPYLFSGTIEENIAIGATSPPSREEVKKAAEKAGISQMIEGLGRGYDTPIGEAGRGLSGGEKQRIALARAFLKQPSVILFDEPTVGLDLQTERILQASMAELAQSSTVITVAHRLHTITHADKILFLDHGEIVAQGTHEELMKSVSDYREMVSVQQGGISQ